MALKEDIVKGWLVGGGEEEVCFLLVLKKETKMGDLTGRREK
jgi:hypothetical protein